MGKITDYYEELGRAVEYLIEAYGAELIFDVVRSWEDEIISCETLEDTEEIISYYKAMEGGI